MERRIILFINIFLTISFQTFAQPTVKFPQEVQLEISQRNRESKFSWEEEKKRIQEVVEEINKAFVIPSDYLNKHSNFLRQKKTGVSRIFPERGCNTGGTVSVKEAEKCSDVPPVKGGGSLYSFRFNNVPEGLPLEWLHFLFGQSEIHFISGKLIVGTPIIQAAISEIGEMEIEEINLKNKAYDYLKKLNWVRTKTQFQKQRLELEKGVVKNGYYYSNSVKATLNKVYAIRSIAYDAGGPIFWHRDQIAVFKIAGIEKDESLILIWKILKDESAPNLIDK